MNPIPPAKSKPKRRPSPNQPRGRVPMMTVSPDLIAFLRGAGPLDGVWFGDVHPSGKPYWWRQFLPAPLPAGRKGRK